ncbi:aftiphilin isoform X1 [Strongylocentrotus purpuratus]|uniref:Aftiphilin clathrin-binding box domain-containing protein n=1 Tax=Strongylocentrotus purpuratus TaxID=7668 RepID=A0A7M7GMT2_STRPU|nr:aftiphilin isoform X1 [Strongylocentrotus purpuratus]
MATSGNGTFIPMVSASPPPMDDVAFDFDDDDDEFSNFSSAPIGLDSPPGKWVGTKKGSFEPIRSDPTDPFHPTDDSHPSNNDDDFEAFAAFGSSSSSHDKQNSNDRLVTNNNIRGHSMNGNESNEEDEFADFAAFESNPVGESNKNDGSYLDNGRQSEVSSSVVLNKNNSHENCESHNAHYPQSIEKHDKDLDKAPDKALHSDDSTHPHSEMPHAGTKAVYQNEGGMLSDIQSRIPSQSSLDYPEPSHKHNNTMGDNDESEVTRRESDSSAAHLEKPSTGSLSLIKESDRQTFDSGIDSIMTPSDSSPEGKDDCSENVISEEDSNSRSSDNGPNTANDDEWGDFDTFSSTGSHTKHSGGMDRAEPADTVNPVAEDSSINDQESDDFGEFGSVARTQPTISDNTGKEVLSNSESLHKSDSGNITNSLSTPQNITTVQCDDDDDDFGDFGNAKQESTDSAIPSSRQDDDDFDDFGDFSSTKSTSEHEISKQLQDKSDGDWGKSSGDKNPAPAGAAEDFGEFGTFGSNPGSMFGSTEDSKDDDEFGTFSSTSGSALGQDDTKSSKSDDFGSFGSSRTVSGSLDSTTIQSGTGSVSSKVPPGGRVERLFKSCFPGSVAAGTSNNQPVQVLRDIVTVKEPVPAKAKADKSSATNGMVWLSLSDMENTMAQKYHWNDSKNSGKLHLSLGIDSRNILPPGRGGRPLFAQELGMLTPSKPGEGSDKIPLGAGGASDAVSSAGAEDAGVASTNSSGTEDTVPKAEFDWSNSGLINPLDANSLNLDFFANERKSSSSRHKSRSVQKVDPELLDLAVSPSDPPLKPALTPSSSSNQSSSSSSSSQKKSPTALDEILKHSSSSMVKQKPKRETGLSSEANSVLDSLPDLSYMLAKVLMFPVASSNSASPSKLAKSDAVPGTGWAESIS